MFATFVIGLREGLEASLIVGIVAAFLQRSGRRDLMRWVAGGVTLAVLLCAAAGAGLYLVSKELPQKQQEALETVVAVIAVAMVTYMVIWMKRHSRDLKAQLEGVASTALASGSAWALVGMAFLAVLREGFETAVFLVAAFNGADNRGAASGGAVLGVALAIALGCGIYRGGVRINLSKFFRVTGFVLVLVAAGLVQTAFRTANEAGWLDWGQQSTVDLSPIIDPGSLQSALITGMLGIQSQPVLIELVAWLIYLVPLGLYVAWPPGKALGRHAVAGTVASGALCTGLAAGALLLFAPVPPAPVLSLTTTATTSGGKDVGNVTVSVNDDRITVSAVDPVTGEVGTPSTLTVTRRTTSIVDGVAATVSSASFPARTTSADLSFDYVAQLNGGRLPLGVRGAGAPADGMAQATTTEQVDVAVAVSTASRQLVGVTWSADTKIVVQGATGQVAVTPVEAATATLSETASRHAVAAASAADAAAADRASDRASALLLGVVAGLLAVVALAVLVSSFRRRPTPPPADATAASDQPAAALERPAKTLSA